ncbi:MAG: ABC transporter substrate-binding protein, partial [Planctomycetes bacterium]|nr:ABC transporter substrate-binding protein [Planctomycetota bacterium]
MLNSIACESDSEEANTEPVVQPSSPISSELQEPVKITIGNHTDVTGPASNAMEFITMALEDMVEYYNDQDLIPGVKFEVITYDGQYDPARDISGYEWLKEQGADLITTAVGPTAMILKSHLGNDRMALFTLA